MYRSVSVCIKVLYTVCMGVLFCKYSKYSIYCKICLYFTLLFANGLVVL